MKQFISCLAVIFLYNVFIFGQDLSPKQPPILASPVPYSKLPKIADQKIQVNLDTQYLEMWSKRGLKWKKVQKFPIVIGESNTPTPIGTFYVFHKEYNAVNRNGTSLGKALDFVMRKEGGEWLRLAIHGWIFDSNGNPGWGPTQGCIQLLRDDMDKLYRWAKKGTPVIIE